MRKALLVSALALGIAGCAATPNDAPVIRDLSASHSAQSNGDTVTVQRGDTLYGIAWRQNMDFRELAQLNNISPPYRLQPGQTLRLSDDAPAAAPSGATSSQGAVVASTGDNPAVAGPENPDWLAPDTEAIERNRRLTSQPLGSSQTTQAASSSQPSGETLAAASQVAGGDGPGPEFNHESPGADGELSAQDRAGSEALARQRAGRTTASGEASSTSTVAAAGGATTGSGTAPSSEAAPAASTSAATSSSSSPGNTGGATGSGSAAADAGTAVAGETSGSATRQETYKPVEDLPWQWPADGQLIGRFGDGSNITAGIDIAGQKGQPVKAAGPGIVVYAGSGVRGYGNLILLKHNDRYLSAYAHNDTLRVRENDVVEAGEVIATMGNTDAESVRLHFEVRQDGQPQDPLEFLPQR